MTRLCRRDRLFGDPSGPGLIQRSAMPKCRRLTAMAREGHWHVLPDGLRSIPATCQKWLQGLWYHWLVMRMSLRSRDYGQIAADRLHALRMASPRQQAGLRLSQASRISFHAPCGACFPEGLRVRHQPNRIVRVNGAGKSLSYAPRPCSYAARARWRANPDVIASAQKQPNIQGCVSGSGCPDIRMAEQRLELSSAHRDWQQRRYRSIVGMKLVSLVQADNKAKAPHRGRRWTPSPVEGERAA